MTATEWNCSQWRCLTPASAMNRTPGWKAKLIHVSGFLDYLNPAIQDLVGPADIIVFQRNLVSEQAFDAMQYWQGMGKPIVIDLDDAYQMLPWSNPAHNFWIENPENRNPPPLVMLEEGLRRADALTAPNRNLLRDWSHVVTGYYLQNYAETAWWTNLPSREELKAKRGLNGRIVIGWGGSVSHYDSFWGSGIREAATAIVRRHPEVLFAICGNDPRIVEQLPVGRDQKVQIDEVPPEEWPKNVATFDIGIAPLFGPYDQRRSWIKGLEYLLGGVPWVGTTGDVYKDLETVGTMIQNGPDNWEGALDAKINNLQAEQAQTASRIALAREWCIDRQLGNYARIYTEIRNHFTAGRGRLPGIVRVVCSPGAPVPAPIGADAAGA